MSPFAHLAAYHGLLLALGLLAAGIGLPLPIAPLLLAAGALAANGDLNVWLAVAIAPCCLILGDVFWFFLGQYYGSGILKNLCRVSLEKDVCIRKTQETFDRYGLSSLLVSRFIPGLSTLASPMAGATKKRFADFLGYESIGSAFYTSLYITLGYLFADQLDKVVAMMKVIGLRATGVIAVVIAIYVVYKFFIRYRLLQKARELAVDATDVVAMREKSPHTLLIDLRGPIDLSNDPFRIADAQMWRYAELLTRLESTEKSTPIVLMCACPNEASAAKAAILLRSKGFTDVFALRNGLDGWRAASLQVIPASIETPTLTISATPVAV